MVCSNLKTASFPIAATASIVSSDVHNSGSCNFLFQKPNDQKSHRLMSGEEAECRLI
jgi:hypothetical protein